MDIPLRVLIIEDSDRDVALEVRALEAADYRVTYVVTDTAAEMKAALIKQAFDIVISDHDLPQFDAPGALAVLKQSGPDIPFIIVSGTIGEEAAVALMKAGAHDYVMKKNLSRLVPAVQRELKEAESRRGRKQVEEALRESEKKYRELYDFLPIPVYEMDLEANITSANRAIYETFRGTEEDIKKGVKVWKLVSPEEVDKSAKNIQRLLKGEQVKGTEYTLMRLDGSVFPAILISSVIYTNGKPVGLRGAVIDISERKQAEEALQESEKKYRRLFECASLGIFQSTPEGKAISVNPAFASMFGYYSPEEAVQSLQNVATDLFVDPNRRAEIIRLMSEQPELRTFENLYRRKDGSSFVGNLNTMPIRDSDGLLVRIEGIIEDITDRKRAVEVLKESENKYRLLADNVNDVIFVLDMNLNYTYISPSVKILRGYEPEEMMKQPSFETLTPSSWDLAMKTLSEVMELEKSEHRKINISRTLQLEMRRKDGTTVWTEAKLSFFRDENQQPVSILGVNRDITERKQAEEKLSQTMENLRKALSGIIQVISDTVETRDPYTAGHQRRVADLAWAIAGEMGLVDDQLEGLVMAGTIHDLGKVSIPAEILSKPSKLTETEYKLIQAHSQIGYDILKGIEFPWPIADMVLQHHERMNGSGYPQGLKGEDILLEARILMVADVVEAMASHRPYRPALGVDAALEEIEKNKGILYDPEVAEVCLGLFREKGFKFE